MKNKKIVIVIFIIISIIIIAINIGLLLIYRASDIASTHMDNGISRYEWVNLLSDYAGTKEYINKEPYFEDVSSENKYFAPIQSMVEWGYISRDNKFNGDKVATGKFIAISAIKTVGEAKLQTYLNINNQISDKEYLKLAIDKGLIQEEDLNRGFSKEEAEEIIERINELYFSEFWPTGIENVTYHKNVIELTDKDVVSYNDITEEIILSDKMNQKMSVGDIIVFHNKGFVIARKIQSGIDNLSSYKLELPELDEVIDNLIASDVKKLGFQNIVEYYGEENLVLVNNTSMEKFKAVSHTISGGIQDAGFLIEAIENSENELEIFITDNDTGMKYQLPISVELSNDWGECSVKLNVNSIFVGSQIKYSSQSGIEYMDVAVDIQSDFQGTITGEEVEEKILLLETPVPLGNGTIGVNIELYMVTTLEGEISLQVELPFQNTICYEKGKGIRNINQDIGVKKPEILASGKIGLITRIAPALIICDYPVIDVMFDMGVETKIDMTLRDNQQICTNVKIAFPVVNISVGDEDFLYHGKESIARILDIAHTWEVVSFENASEQINLHHEVLPDGSRKYVKNCTYGTYQEEADSTYAFQTYATKYGEMYDEKIPTFQFDYPSNWLLISENVSEGSEYIELSNGKGAVIRFQYITSEYAYGNSRVTDEILVEKIADSQLTLHNSPEANLEGTNFVVAKVYTISSLQHFTGQEREDEQIKKDTNVYVYAIKPETECGTHTLDGNFERGFQFNGLLEFTAEIPENTMIEMEQEIIDILSSFRVENEDSNVATDDPIYDALMKGDYSYFAGTYKACGCYKDMYGGGEDIENLILHDNGIITGGGMSFLPNLYPDLPPISVKKQDDGSYLCQVTYEDDASQNYFLIYPEGTIGENPYIYNDPFLTEKVYIQYMKFDGGVTDIIYYKIDE